MNIILVGSGTETSKLNSLLTGHKFTIQAMLASFTPATVQMLPFDVIIVVAPEAAVLPETLRTVAVEHARTVIMFATQGDALGTWAISSGVKTYAYPPASIDLDALIRLLKQLEAGNVDTANDYPKMAVGGDMMARIQGGMATRKIAITSPKGGTGKTTLSANLAVALGLCGVHTFLVDADANAGALPIHLRLQGTVKQTLPHVMRRAKVEKNKASTPGTLTTMAALAAAGQYVDVFTPIEKLPTLRALPGLITDDLDDPIFQDEELVNSVIQGLYEVGTSMGGVTIMDVGINPAHPLHRAVLRSAEAIVIVVKPEIPDIGEVRRWINRMISSLAATTGKKAATEFIGSHVKLVYNMVHNPDAVREVGKLLNMALAQDKIEITFAPNALIPYVDPELSSASVNSSDVKDVLVWRYLTDHVPELAPYALSMLDLSSLFVPTAREAAARINLIPGEGRKQSPFNLFRRKSRAAANV